MKSKKRIFFCCVLVFLLPFYVNAGWKHVAPMPNQRYGHDATLGPDADIYVMGGMVLNDSIPKKYNNGRYSNLVYDPEKDTWTVLEPVPGWVRAEKNLLMFFNTEANDWDWIEKIPEKKDYYKNFDPATKTWKIEKIVDPPNRIRRTNIQRQGDGVAIVTGKDGYIYWIGGKGSWMGHGESIVLPYDPMKSRWPNVTPKRHDYGHGAYTYKTIIHTDMPPMIERRIDHEAVIISDGKIFVMGGRQEELRKSHRDDMIGNGKIQVSDTVECYDPKTNKWEYRKPMTVKRFLFEAVVGPDDRIYTFGGAQKMARDGSRKAFNITEVYNPKTDTWSYRTPMPEPRYSHSAVFATDGRIYVIGGARGGYDRPPLKDVFIYDPVKDTWKKGPRMKLPRATLAAVATPDGKIYAIGGTDVGAYKNRKKLNFFLPKGKELYEGKVQDTVEVLDIFKLK